MANNDSIRPNADKSPSGLTPANYDDKLKATVCDWLEQEMSVKTGTKLADENIADLKQRRLLGYGAAGLALVLLGSIFGMMCYHILYPSSFLQGWPKAVYISASLLSCTVICAVFINGVFRKSDSKSNPTSIKDVIDIVRGFHSSE